MRQIKLGFGSGLRRRPFLFRRGHRLIFTPCVCARMSYFCFCVRARLFRFCVRARLFRFRVCARLYRFRVCGRVYVFCVCGRLFRFCVCGHLFRKAKTAMAGGIVDQGRLRGFLPAIRQHPDRRRYVLLCLLHYFLQVPEFHDTSLYMADVGNECQTTFCRAGVILDELDVNGTRHLVAHEVDHFA